MSRRVVVGISGARRNAAAAVSVDGEIRAVCEQERLTRVRRVGLIPGSLPLEALDAVLHAGGGLRPSEVETYVTAEDAAALPPGLPAVKIGHHQAHAATGFYLSRYEQAVVLVCDQHSREQISAWEAKDGGLASLDWPRSPVGFAALYSDCCSVFGLPRGHEHDLEALARLDCNLEALPRHYHGSDDDRLNDVIGYRDGVLWTSSRWPSAVRDWLDDDGLRRLSHRAHVAGTFQRHLGRLLVALAKDVGARTGLRRLCLGGGLFYNTYFTTVLRRCDAFDDVFVAPNPGNAGLAVGAALVVDGGASNGLQTPVSPFLGPQYEMEVVKRTLDNCKLSYECVSEHQAVALAVEALLHGQLVGWFQGRMEWAHRALGNRSILANPFSPYVLDNLNVFLKQRERHWAYGVSVTEEAASALFDGPPASRYMEYDYHPTDPARFREIMPEGAQTIRVQTIPEHGANGAAGQFRALHESFGEATGTPVLVNTSFNGFSEPIVCSPRDAIRVFYGTGLDMLVLGRFVLRK